MIHATDGLEFWLRNYALGGWLLIPEKDTQKLSLFLDFFMFHLISYFNSLKMKRSKPHQAQQSCIFICGGGVGGYDDIVCLNPGPHLQTSSLSFLDAHVVYLSNLNLDHGKTANQFLL